MIITLSFKKCDHFLGILILSVHGRHALMMPAGSKPWRDLGRTSSSSFQMSLGPNSQAQVPSVAQEWVNCRHSHSNSWYLENFNKKKIKFLWSLGARWVEVKHLYVFNFFFYLGNYKNKTPMQVEYTGITFSKECLSLLRGASSLESLTRVLEYCSRQPSASQGIWPLMQ